MKIAIVDSYFSVVDLELQKALESVGFDTWIITSNKQHIQYRKTSIKYKSNNYKHIMLDCIESPIVDLNLYFPFPIMKNLISTLEKLEIDIVHTSEHFSSPSFWCNFKKGNWRTVLIERLGTLDGIVNKFKLHAAIAKRFIFPKVDAFAALSSFALDTLRHLGCKRKITIIPNPIDTNTFNVTIPWKERRNVVLYVGRLLPIKCVDILIRSMPIVRQKIPDAELWIIGSGKYEDYYKKLASGKDYIKFLGSISRERLPLFYNQAKVYVILSKSKATGIGMATEEAMACGVPIIGSDNIPFDEHEHIYYFTSKLGEEMIANNIIKCINEGENYARNARIVAEKVYSYKAIGIAYKKMIDKIY
jgi:glycosyltransferase involved in cell wall biosynthesis